MVWKNLNFQEKRKYLLYRFEKKAKEEGFDTYRPSGSLREELEASVENVPKTYLDEYIETTDNLLFLLNSFIAHDKAVRLSKAYSELEGSNSSKLSNFITYSYLRQFFKNLSFSHFNDSEDIGNVTKFRHYALEKCEKYEKLALEISSV